MKHVLRSVTFIALVVFSAGAATQSEQQSGSIKGRVTVEGKAQPGVLVSLFKADDLAYERRPLATATTDAEGDYRFARVAAGRYSVSTFSPLFVNTHIDHNGQNGRLVSLDAGEAIEDINFSLVRGGVITGRVIDTEGNPVISQAVNLIKMVDGRIALGFRSLDPQIMMTDDRGVYRIYGVLPGSYVVMVGYPPHINRSSPSGGRYSSYLQTYHPDVTEQSKATVVEVTPGGEATGIDIRVGRVEKTYVATGRMVEAETGRPVPNATFAMGLGENPRPMMGGGGYRANEKGEFRIELATPGRVTIFPSTNGEDNLKGEPFSFDLTTERVTGLEIKLHRAQTISGSIVAEGSSKQPKFSSLTLSVRYMAPERARAVFLRGKVGEDGSFTIGGAVAGKAHFYLNASDSTLPKPWLVRVERNGADHSEGLEVAEGENISDLRLVVAYGKGTVRGQVKIEGHAPEDASLFTDYSVFVGFRHTKAARFYTGAQIDARGRFVMEGLPDGEYELTLSPSRSMPNDEAGRDLMSRFRAVRQTVTVADGAESTVTLLLDLSEKK